MGKRNWLVIGICIAAVLGAILVTAGLHFFDAHKRVAIPGTGVTMILPDGVVISPLGTVFSDDKRDVMVGIVVGPSAMDMVNRYAFPNAAEPFRSSTISGDLYKRTRAQDKGAWDGWFLDVSRGDRQLAVLISYTGFSSGKFQELKKYLSTVSWNDRELDPSVSFGLKLNVSGLHLVPDVAGGLKYTADGKPSSDAPYMFVSAGSFSLHGDMSKFHQLCEKEASVIAHGSPISVRYQSKNKLWVCDAWAGSYEAVLMLPDGSIAQVLAAGDPNVFQSALLNAQIIPRPSSGKH